MTNSFVPQAKIVFQIPKKPRPSKKNVLNFTFKVDVNMSNTSAVMESWNLFFVKEMVTSSFLDNKLSVFHPQSSIVVTGITWQWSVFDTGHIVL